MKWRLVLLYLNNRGKKTKVPRLQESQILQNSSKFSSTLHFLQESYKFVQESQPLQICYNVEHFIQNSDNIFAKNSFFGKKFLQKLWCVISNKISKISTQGFNVRRAVML